MNLTLLSLSLILPFLRPALADVEFTIPKPASSHRADHVLTAHWKDSGHDPLLSELTHYDLLLCAGGDTRETSETLSVLMEEAVFARGNSVSFKIDPGVGGNEENAYFLKMISSGPEIAAVINYSPRFTLTEMTGSFSPSLQNAIQSIHDPTGPAVQDSSKDDTPNLRKRQVAAPGGGGNVPAGAGAATNAAADADGINKHTIPWTMQHGPTRYAPMAKKPGTTITAKSASRQYPTSSYDIATTYLPTPDVQTTVSATVTYSTHSIENTATPAPQPGDLKMKRFLERWKD